MSHFTVELTEKYPYLEFHIQWKNQNFAKKIFEGIFTVSKYSFIPMVKLEIHSTIKTQWELSLANLSFIQG